MYLKLDDNMIEKLGKENEQIDSELASLVDEAFKLLVEKDLTVGFAESATGGMLSKLFTDRPGASRCYHGSVTSYVNSVKNGVLGVRQEDLDEYGAVSWQVAAQMADGARKLLGADIALSDTGIAGPGASEDKEEGLFYFGLSDAEKTLTKKEVFRGTRDQNRKQASRLVLAWLCEYLNAL